MAKAQYSLRGRIFWTLAAFNLGFSVLASVLGGVLAWNFADGWRHSARPLAQEVVESLRLQGGELLVRPTSNLARWQAEDPGLWFVATDGVRTVSVGPTPIPPDAVAHGRAAFVEGFELSLTADTARPFAQRGAAFERARIGPAGPVIAGLLPPQPPGPQTSVTVLAGGLAPSLGGAGRQGLILSGVLSFLIGGLMFGLPTLAALWWALSREARQLKASGAAVAAIGPRDLSARVDASPLPREIAPLADGVNTALERLQAGFARERLFATMAAHELRTPLAVLMAHLDALPDDPARALLVADARRMKSLVEDLLVFARLAGRRDETSEVDLALLARQAIADLARAADQVGVTLQFEETAPARIQGSAAGLRLMIRNLVDNAIRHSPRGATVSVRLDPGPTLIVADQGPGFQPDEQDQVFEPFFRGRGAEGPGSGLGLAVVREVADAHGATVQICSRDPIGASVEVRFIKAR